MKRFKQHWTAGPLSWLLSVSLALPAVLALLALPRTAHAQNVNRQPTWAVVTFTNTSGYGGNEEGVQAADGFVVELGKSNKYNVVPRTQTQQGIADLGLSEPLDVIGLQRLARSTGIDADAVATGQVASVTFSSNPRRATVALIVRVVDRLSGELINGAVVQGASTPRPIPTNDDDALVNQAIENADFNAVKQIAAFNLPRATVLIHRDADSVTLNKGTQDGLFDGLKMLVTRNGSEVGRLIVSDASPDESEATVTDRGLGIQAQDVATAIYQLPPFTTGPSGFHVGTANVAPPSSDNTPRGNTRPLFTGLLGAALGIGAIVALAGVAHSGVSSDGTANIGGGIVGAVSANLTANGITQFSSLPANSPYSNNPLFVPLSIQINYNNGDISPNQLLEYHVYRNPPPSILTSGTNFNPPVLAFNEVQPLPIFVGSSPQFDSAQNIPPFFVRKPDPTNNTAVVGPENFYDGTTTLETPIAGTGLNVGDRVSYSIEALYDVPNLTAGQTGVSGGPVGVGGGVGGGGGTTSTGTTTTTGTTGTTGTTSGQNGSFIYTLSDKGKATTNAVTYLQPVLTRYTIPASGYPDPASAATYPDVDVFGGSTGPANVAVTLHEVYANPGDNGGVGIPLQYALEFSTDQGFSGSNTQRFTQVGPSGGDQVNFRGAAGTPSFQFTGINLTSKFPNAGTLYFRVGVRDQRNGGDEGSNPFLWSTVDPFNPHVVPLPLTPSPNGTLARQAKVLSGVAALAPTKAGHVRGAASGAASPSAVPASNGLRPLFVPSQTLHGDTVAPTAHTGGPRAGVAR